LSFNNQSVQSKRAPKKILVDHNIRARQVLVIDGDSNENLGLMPLHEALRKANDSGLNLVQMGPVPEGSWPTCKILDYGKYRFEESKREKALQKKQREAQIKEKEISFCPDTAINDLKIKAKKAVEFLDEGDKVRINIKCRGRESTHVHMIQQTLNSFVDCIPNGVARSTSPLTGSERLRVFSYFIEREDPEKVAKK